MIFYWRAVLGREGGGWLAIQAGLFAAQAPEGPLFYSNARNKQNVISLQGDVRLLR